MPDTSRLLVDSQTSLGTRHTGFHWLVTCAYVISLTAGSGFLALPKAVDESGYTGLFLLLMFGVAACYTGNILSQCWLMAGDVCTTDEQKQALYKRPYAAIAEIAFQGECVESYARHLIAVFVNFAVFGSAIVYILLSTENVYKLLAAYTSSNLHYCDIIPILGAVVIVMVIIQRLMSRKWFWIFIFLSTILTLFASVLLTIEVVKNEKDEEEMTAHGHGKGNFNDVFTSLGMLCFAWSGHSLFPFFQSEMGTPKEFQRSIILAFIVIAVIFVPCTYASFFIYGNNVDDNILETVFQTSQDRTIANIVLVSLVIHLLLSVVVVVNPVCLQLEHALGWDNHQRIRDTILSLTIRTLYMALVIGMAMLIPHFDSVMSLVGASSTGSLTFVAPSILYMKLSKHRHSATYRRIPFHTSCLQYMLALYGFVVSILATIASISNLAEKVNHGHPCYSEAGVHQVP